MIRNVFRGNRSRVFLLLIALSSLPAGWWLRDALSDRTEPASADIPVVKCEELVGVFDAYPLVYLGDSFEGLPLVYCGRRQEGGTPDRVLADRVPPTDYFVFVYGSCTIEPGQTSCAVPLQVTIDPRCGPPLDGTTPAETIRGSQVQVVGAHGLLVETPQYKVMVSTGSRGAESEALVRRAFLELRGANELAAKLTVDGPLADPALVSAPAKDKDACLTETMVRPPAPEPGSSGSQLDLAVADNGTSLTVVLNLSGAVPAPYKSAQITFDVPGGLLQFSSGSAGGALAGALCVGGATPDTPVPGRTKVNFGCSLPGGKTVSGTGTLLNVTLNEIGNGCADIVMDAARSGTTTSDSSGAQPNTYGVSTAQVATVGTGGVCPP